MQIARNQYRKQLQELLQKKNLVWMYGVRRVGKTTLCQSFPEAKYFDCELPSTRRQLEDPEFFWRQHDREWVILDEVHRLTHPSEVLKIAADHFPSVKVIATGSSTLAAKKKFKDTLTDRKRNLWVFPLLVSEINDLPDYNIDKRLLHGGLPPVYIGDSLDDEFYVEWLDSFWAKDVQELFTIDKKTSFLKLAELILRQSGAIFEASSFSAPCEISRQTVTHYLDILATTLFATVVRPYSEGGNNEITLAPKVYGFDTGFVCFAKGWKEIRNEDRGLLIEHLVLNELIHQYGNSSVFYWRSKQKQEVDFIVKPKRGKEIHAIECKSNSQNFDAKNLKTFRKNYPHGKNILYAANVGAPLAIRKQNLEIQVLPLGTPFS